MTTNQTTHQLIERYKTSPTWLKGIVILCLIYLTHTVWTHITRTRRELQAASWILNQRRKAGIPDSDKRPFKIAKAAVEAERKKANQSNPPAQPPLTNHLRPQPNLPPPSPALSNSAETIKSLNDHQEQVSVASHTTSNTTKTKPNKNNKPFHPASTSLKDSPRKSNNLKPSSSSSLKPTHSPWIKSDQPLTGRSLQKRVAPLPENGSDADQTEIEEENWTIRNRKKAKTQKNPTSSSSSQQQQGEDTAGPAFQGKLSGHNTSPRKSNHDGSSPKKVQLRKKRILSDCVGELDHDHAARIKKGRSEKPEDLPHPRTPTEATVSGDGLVSMQVEEDGDLDGDGEGDGEEDEEGEGEAEEINEIEDEEDEKGQEKDEINDEKKDSDAEGYMTKDGQKQKLVQIRLNTPESNYSTEEGATEYRWVTRRQFQDLGQRGMLLLEDDEWEGDSMTSIDSIDSNKQALSTPSKRTTNILVERGPIWSIEGKKTSSCLRKSPLSSSTRTCDISPSSKPGSVSSTCRPRNSLGRIRLSLPANTPITPASPLQRSRARLASPLKPFSS